MMISCFLVLKPRRLTAGAGRWHARRGNYGLFVRKTFRSQERRVPVENFRSRDFSFPGTLVSSQDLSFRGRVIKLHSIYSTVGIRKHSKDMSRYDSVLLNRFRIGHSRLTHSYLLCGDGLRVKCGMRKVKCGMECAARR